MPIDLVREVVKDAGYEVASIEGVDKTTEQIKTESRKLPDVLAMLSHDLDDRRSGSLDNLALSGPHGPHFCIHTFRAAPGAGCCCNGCGAGSALVLTFGDLVVRRTMRAGPAMSISGSR